MKSSGEQLLDLLLPAATKLGQGNVFTGVCDSVQRGGVPGLVPGGGVYLVWSGGVPGRHPPDQVHPPGTRYPPRTRYTPPGTRYTPLIRTTRGRYASHWNAFLCDLCIQLGPCFCSLLFESRYVFLGDLLLYIILL